MKKILVFILALLCLAMPLTAAAKGNVYVVAERETFTNADTTLPYRLLLPDNYDENGNYPLLIFFHGAGERGNDNQSQFINCVQYIYDNMPEDCIIVAPQCPLNNQWVDTPWKDGTYSADNVPQSNELHAAMELVEELKENYAVDPDRVYAAGISMGSFAVWDSLIRYNHIFAAGIAICGAGDPTKAEVLKDTPLYVFHGETDITVPVSGSRDMVTAIREAGGTVIEYTEYPKVGHLIWDMAFAEPELLKNLLSHKLSDRITIGNPQNSESSETDDVSETVDSSAETEGDGDKSFLTVALIVGGALIVVAAVVAVVIVLNKKKK